MLPDGLEGGQGTQFGTVKPCIDLDMQRELISTRWTSGPNARVPQPLSPRPLTSLPGSPSSRFDDTSIDQLLDLLRNLPHLS